VVSAKFPTRGEFMNLNSIYITVEKYKELNKGLTPPRRILGFSSVARDKILVLSS